MLIHNITVQSFKKTIKKKSEMFFIIEKNIHVLIIIYLRGKGWSIMAETNFYVSIYDNYATNNLVCVLFVFVFVSKNTTKIEPINPKQPAKREITKSQHKFYNTNGVYNTSLFVVKNCSL